MKLFALFIFAASLLTAPTITNAQTKKGAASTLPSGEIVLMPEQSKPGAPALLEEKEPIIRNVSQIRTAKIVKRNGGYFEMAPNQDWGANATLNGYGYQFYKPTLPFVGEDLPIFPSGSEEAANDDSGESNTTTSEIPW